MTQNACGIADAVRDYDVGVDEARNWCAANEILFACDSDLDQVCIVQDDGTKELQYICTAVAAAASGGVMDVSLQFHKLSPLYATDSTDQNSSTFNTLKKGEPGSYIHVQLSFSSDYYLCESH